MAGPPVDSYVDNKFKIIFVMYNLVMWSSGLVLSWFGIWLEVELSRYIRLESQAVSFFLLGIGSLIMMYNSISCFCVLKGFSSGLLNVYGLVLGVLFVIELMLSISMVWLKQRLQAKFKDHHVNLQDQNIDINLIQSSLNCCGIKGVSDWLTLDTVVPSSCCVSGVTSNCDTKIVENLWPAGCYNQLSYFIDNNIGLMSLLVVAFAAVTLIGVFCSFSWAKKISTSYESLY